VNALRPVSFEYNENNQKTIGFIAEEVAPLDSRLVFYEADGVTPKGITYDKFVPILTKAIQEIWTRIQTVLTWFSASGDRINVQGMICVDDTCLTKDQFKILLIKSGDASYYPNHGTATESFIINSATSMESDSTSSSSVIDNATTEDASTMAGINTESTDSNTSVPGASTTESGSDSDSNNSASQDQNVTNDPVIENTVTTPMPAPVPVDNSVSNDSISSTGETFGTEGQ
jgi:hypothetical protein